MWSWWARAPLFIHDIFVRPLPEAVARRGVDRRCSTPGALRQEVEITLSLYGQNFAATCSRIRRMS